MCGIAGIYCPSGGSSAEQNLGNLKEMTNSLSHRGPDGEGYWSDQEEGIYLGHRRLSIIDLADTGAQPMHSHSGRYVLVFNGEIYNYRELRLEIERVDPSIRWRGSSDTEVLLALIDQIGLQNALIRLDAMFGLALWDRLEKSLTLARDPFGEKPVYYGWVAGSLLFASELTAFRNHDRFDPQIDGDSIASFLRYSYIPAPRTVYQSVSKLNAASVVTFTREAISVKRAEQICYWDKQAELIGARKKPFKGDMKDALTELETTFKNSTSRRMVSDVPIGALLSGGIDSTLTAAYMQKISPIPIKTFTIGMNVDGYNEAAYAAKVARYLGTEHTELNISPEDLVEAIPRMPEIYDEPFADSSQVPTYLVSKLASQQIKVALTGDGGDELFAGYNRHFQVEAIWQKMGKVPRPLRSSLKGLFEKVPASMISLMAGLLSSNVAAELKAGRGIEKIRKIASLMSVNSERDLHNMLLATYHGQIDNGKLAAEFLADRLSPELAGMNLGERMMAVDVANYLPDDILVKVDRASMAVGLETRTPFLSRELFHFAWSLPWDYKTDGKQGKRILRSLLYENVPREMVDRPKAGFAIPVGFWLKNELSQWMQDMLQSPNAIYASFLDREHLQQLWREHQSGRASHENILWSVAMLEGWMSANRGKSG